MPNDDLQVAGASKPAKANAIAGQLATNTDQDYGTAGQTPITGNSLDVVRGLAQELVNRIAKVKALEGELSMAKESLADIEERRLPDLMEQYGLPKFDFKDATTGIVSTIKLETGKFRVSMPANEPENEGKRREIFAWLRTVDLGGIMNKNMVVPMGLVGDNQVTDILMEFKKQHPDLNPGVEEKVHSSTLTAQITKLKKDGKNVHEALNVLPVRRVKVKET